MTAALYLNMDDKGVTLEQLENACSEAISTLAGAFLILRVFAENGDEDTVDLCNALKALLMHVDSHVADIQPAPTQPMALKASVAGGAE